ncbi:flagellar brake protein [Actinoplanes sp. NPDC049668]|uniref:flagellar brake protein n=1 Tax=unclassified Actinoplanes TaxID=2626549 RepID=UPI0033B653B9
MSTTLADLPDINDLVDVTLDSRPEPLAAVISAVTADTVLLREPMDRTGRMVRPDTGERGLLVWGEGSQLRQAPIAVLETNGSPAPTWLVRLTAQAERTQRRSFVRANVSLPVVVRHAGVDLEVTAVDLSEGGMRCYYTGTEINFGRGDEVVAAFETGRELSATAMVVRMQRGDEERPTELGLRFADLKMGEADDIRRYVFRQLLEQRRRGTD